MTWIGDAVRYAWDKDLLGPIALGTAAATLAGTLAYQVLICVPRNYDIAHVVRSQTFVGDRALGEISFPTTADQKEFIVYANAKLGPQARAAYERRALVLDEGMIPPVLLLANKVAKAQPHNEGVVTRKKIAEAKMAEATERAKAHGETALAGDSQN